MERGPLERLIHELGSLISSDAAEDRFQKCLEEHPVAFEVMGYGRVIPHPILERGNAQKPVSPDFMCQLSSTGLWEIVELKTPATKVMRTQELRETFYKEFETYVSQCRKDYSKHFDDDTRRAAFERRYKTKIQRLPHSYLVAGRAGYGFEHAVHEELTSRTPVVRHETYDAFLARFNAAHAATYGPWENKPGLSLHLVFVPVSKNIAVVAAGISPNHDSIALRVNRAGDLLFEVVDSNGTCRTAVASQASNALRIGKLNYAVCEVTDGLQTVRVNGTIFAENRGQLSLVTPTQPESPWVVGSDLARNATTDMLVYRLAIYERTLTLDTRRKIDTLINQQFRPYLTADATHVPGGIRITGHQHFASRGGVERPTDLVAPTDELRAVWWGKDPIPVALITPGVSAYPLPPAPPSPQHPPPSAEPPPPPGS